MMRARTSMDLCNSQQATQATNTIITTETYECGGANDKKTGQVHR